LIPKFGGNLMLKMKRSKNIFYCISVLATVLGGVSLSSKQALALDCGPTGNIQMGGAQNTAWNCIRRVKGSQEATINDGVAVVKVDFINVCTETVPTVYFNKLLFLCDANEEISCDQERLRVDGESSLIPVTNFASGTQSIEVTYDLNAAKHDGQPLCDNSTSDCLAKVQWDVNLKLSSNHPEFKANDVPEGDKVSVIQGGLSEGCTPESTDMTQWKACWNTVIFGRQGDRSFKIPIEKAQACGGTFGKVENWTIPTPEVAQIPADDGGEDEEEDDEDDSTDAASADETEEEPVTGANDEEQTEELAETPVDTGQNDDQTDADGNTQQISDETTAGTDRSGSTRDLASLQSGVDEAPVAGTASHNLGSSDCSGMDVSDGASSMSLVLLALFGCVGFRRRQSDCAH